MRYAARVDHNQAEIVDALRRIGAHVQPLHTVGQGCPDLLVSHKGRWYVIECKDSEKAPSARMLTEDQVDWISKARAPVFVVTTADEAVAVVA